MLLELPTTMLMGVAGVGEFGGVASMYSLEGGLASR
jgi:hypothetical protein